MQEKKLLSRWKNAKKSSDWDNQPLLLIYLPNYFFTNCLSNSGLK